MNVKDSIKWFMQGFAMGLANMMPGISGGTIALIMGIYERLIHAINTIPLKSSFTIFSGRKEKLIKELKEVDYEFLFPLIIGVGLATLILALLIGAFIEDYRGITFSFFFGLILASAGILYHKIEHFEAPMFIPGLVGFFFSFYIVGLSPFGANHSLPVIFLSGLLSIPSMILPGISGSTILVILQQWDYLRKALTQIDILVIVTFMSGAITGLFSFAKIVDFLFERYIKATLVFLFGLVLGGLREPAKEAFATNPSFLEWVIPATIGALLVSVLDCFYRLKSD